MTIENLLEPAVDTDKKTDIRLVFDAKESLSNASDIGLTGTRPIPEHFNNRFMHAPVSRVSLALGAIEKADWDDWRWQQRKRFRTIDQLEPVIDVSDEERKAF